MRDVRPNILYLAHRMPYPPDKGDRIRTFHILRYLAGQANVHLACLADEDVSEPMAAALREHCRRIEVVPLRSAWRWLRAVGSWVRGRTVTEGAFSSAALRTIIREWTRDTDFSAVLVSASSMVQYLKLAELRDVPKVVDLVDVDSEKWRDYSRASRWPRSWFYRVEGRRLRRLERQLPAWTRGVTLVSDAEADLYRGFCAAGMVRAVTNGVDLDYFRPQSHVAGEPACVFVGALDYLPNIDAACWFSKEIWPRIRAARSDARFWLVGRRPAPVVRRLASLQGIEVIGQVPDVRPYVARAALAVVPLRIARGLQNKVLEALSMGKAVVSSPEALVGLRNGEPPPVLKATSPNQWTEQVLRVLQDAALREDLGRAARRYVEEHHSWESCLRPLTALLDLPEHVAGRGPLQPCAAGA